MTPIKRSTTSSREDDDDEVDEDPTSSSDGTDSSDEGNEHDQNDDENDHDDANGDLRHEIGQRRPRSNSMSTSHTTKWIRNYYCYSTTCRIGDAIEHCMVVGTKFQKATYRRRCHYQQEDENEKVGNVEPLLSLLHAEDWRLYGTRRRIMDHNNNNNNELGPQR